MASSLRAANDKFRHISVQHEPIRVKPDVLEAVADQLHGQSEAGAAIRQAQCGRRHDRRAMRTRCTRRRTT
jgi:hypothetical protein